MILTLMLTGVFCIAQVGLTYVYFNGFFEKRAEKKGVFFTVSFLLMVFLKLLPGQTLFIIKTVLFLAVIGIIVFAFFQGSLVKKLYHILFFFVILLLSDLCLSFMARTYLMTFDFDDSLTILLYFIPNFLSLLLSFIIIKGILYIKADAAVELSSNEYLLLGVTPVASVFGISWLSLHDNLNLLYPYLFLLAVNACTMFVYCSFLRKNEKIQKYRMMEAQNRYYQSYLNSQKELIQVKHDLKNILLELDYCVKAGESGKTNSILSELINDVINSYHNYSGCIPVDAVLSSKLYIMEQNHIGYTTDIQVPADIKLDDIEVSAILGNMLDNATEAVLRLDESRRMKIGIWIKYMEQKLVIRIINSSKDLKIDSEQDSILSEKIPGRVGVGIGSIKYRVRKLGGYYDFSCEDNVFQAVVVIPV